MPYEYDELARVNVGISVLQELEFGLTMRFVMHAPDFVNRTKDPAGSIPVASTAEPAIKVNLAQREHLTRKNASWKAMDRKGIGKALIGLARAR
jgi:hypothetical protein